MKASYSKVQGTVRKTTQKTVRAGLLISLALIVSQAAFAQTAKSKAKPAVKATESTISSPAPVRSHSYSNYGGEYLNEIQTSFSGGSFETYKVGTQTVTQIVANGSYLRLIRPQIQAGGELGFSYVNATTTQTTLTFMAVGKYNFDSDLRESFYVSGGAGLLSAMNATGGTDTKFGIMIGGGRRIPLFDKISYSPEARLYKKGDLDMNIEIQFLNLSIMF